MKYVLFRPRLIADFADFGWVQMAWHLGYPLSQTLFTSVYLEGIVMPLPLKTEDAYFTRAHDDLCHRDPMLKILRAYCLGLLKACFYVNERIKFEHYYEVSNS